MSSNMHGFECDFWWEGRCCSAQISRGNVIRVCGYKMGLFIRHARSHGSDDYADVIGSDGKLHLVNYNDIEWMQPDGSLVHDSSVPMFNVRD